ncbi:MAG: sulfate permease [Salinibacterium sp.]|nr:sulfate permease [Salinibacterium sp.]
MFGLIWAVTARTHYAVRRFMPTNIVLDALHTRRGLKWGVPAMLLALPYALAAMFCAGLVAAGGSGWLNVLALLFVWNALKLVLTGPATVIRLLRVRGRESQARRREMPTALSEGVEPERFEEPVLTSTLSSRRG